MTKRDRPNPLLRKLRNAQRHRQAQIARPQPALVKTDNASLQTGAEVMDAAAWTRRSVLLALVPLSIVGMVALFVLSFVGSREIVGFLVGREYVPAAIEQGDAPPPPEPMRVAEPLPTRSEQTLERLPENAQTAPQLKSGTDPALARLPVTDMVPPSQDEDVPPPLPAAVENAVPDSETVPVGETAVLDDASIGTPAPVAQEEALQTPTPEPVPVPETLAHQAPVDVAPEYETALLEQAPEYTGPETFVPVAVPVAEAPAVAPAPPAPDEAAAVPERKAPVTVVAKTTADQASPDGKPDNEEPQSRRDNRDQSDEYRRKQEELAAQATANAAQMIGKGHSLLADGDVLQARQLFSRSLESGSAEAALALGRSFDPKFLAGVDNPNAAADPVTARRWYEEWYRRSIAQGAISPNVRLEKLLQAMNLN